MNETPELQLVTRLIAHRVGEHPSPAALAAAAEDTCLQLCSKMAAVLGHRGFDSVVLYALDRAQKKFPCLGTVVVRRDGDGPCLSGLRALECGPSPEEFVKALRALPEQILVLLNMVLGHALARRYIEEAWPEVAQLGLYPEVEEEA